MGKPLPPLQNPVDVAKKALACVLLVLFVIAPDQFLHYVFVIMHTAYESIAFILEEIIRHVFHLSKYQCQLIVFYLMWAAGLMVLYRFWRKWPELSQAIKHRLYRNIYWVQGHMMQIWNSSSLTGKIKWVLLQIGFTLGVFAFLLT